MLLFLLRPHLVAVEGVDDQRQQLVDFSLECILLPVRHGAAMNEAVLVVLGRSFACDQQHSRLHVALWRYASA